MKCESIDQQKEVGEQHQLKNQHHWDREATAGLMCECLFGKTADPVC